jgi:hypothetical protein
MQDDASDFSSAHLPAGSYDTYSIVTDTCGNERFFLGSTQRISFGGALRQHRQQQDHWDILQSRMRAANQDPLHVSAEVTHAREQK